MKSNAPQKSKKQNDFDSVFAKYAAQLPKEYMEQFKRPDVKGPTKDQKVKQAVKMGKKVEVVAKGTGNKAHPQNLNIGKLLDDTEVIEIKEVPKVIATQVAQARAEKKLTQEQLAVKIMEQVSVVRDLERAEGTYDPKVVEKIEKFLNVKFDRPWKK